VSTLNGISMYGDERGQAVLWCHGGLSGRLDAALLQDAACRVGVRIISVDRPAIGGARPQDLRSVAAWARGVSGVLDALEVEELSVAAWSAGGPHALALAAEMPGRVRRVTTVASMHPLTEARYRSALGLQLHRVLLRLSPRWSALARRVVAASMHAPDRVLVATTLHTAVPAERAAMRAAADEIVAFLRAAVEQGPGGVVAEGRG